METESNADSKIASKYLYKEQSEEDKKNTFG